MIGKTKDAQKEAVAAEVKRNHAYDTPAILFLPAEGGDPAYIDWILSESSGQGISVKA